VLKVFTNRVLGMILIPKGKEVIGVWRKLKNVKHHDLYSLQNMREGGAISHT
jgi:hypothetical protein